MPPSPDVEKRAAAAALSANGTKPADLIEFSNGIVLRVKSVSPLAIRQAAIRVPRPKPPMSMIKEKGREEENPNDPAYLAALEEYEEVSALAGLNVLVLLGTTLETVPEGLQGPDDEGWVGDLQYVGVLPADFDDGDKRARYLAWVRYYAVANIEDHVKLMIGPMAKAGVSEEDVAKAIDSFPSRATRRANNKRDTKSGRRQRP